MNFPLIPLIEDLRGLNELNLAISIPVVMLMFFLAGLFLIQNAYGPNRYDKAIARPGLWLLGIAIFVAIVGMVYILIFVGILYLIYWLVYWVLWRYLILNIKAAFCRKKPKNTDSVYIPEEY